MGRERQRRERVCVYVCVCVCVCVCELWGWDTEMRTGQTWNHPSNYDTWTARSLSKPKKIFKPKLASQQSCEVGIITPIL